MPRVALLHDRRRPRSLRRVFDELSGRAVIDHRVEPVIAGRLLLLGQGAFVLGAAPLIHPSTDGWRALGLVTVAMTVLILVSFRVPWGRLPDTATVVFPLLTMGALSALSLADPGTFAPVTGFLTLSFVYLGLTQRPRSSLYVMPAALMTMTLAYGTISGEIVIRLVLGCCVWSVTAEALAWLTQRYASLTGALQRAAYQDPLTGVPNRRDLDSHLALATDRDIVVICDLDHFKRINDTLGHAMGDHVLADFGALLRAELRSSDYFARYGGEEFVLILSNVTAEARTGMLARLHERWALLQPAVTFSTGSAQFDAQRRPAETLALADRALYEAKAAGRNTDRVAEAIPARH